jgi:hypothetical protein
LLQTNGHNSLTVSDGPKWVAFLRGSHLITYFTPICPDPSLMVQLWQAVESRQTESWNSGAQAEVIFLGNKY